MTSHCNVVVCLQSVFNGMHVIFIPYALMKIDPASWMKMITKFKGGVCPHFERFFSFIVLLSVCCVQPLLPW